MLSRMELREFVRASNAIEGIYGVPLVQELQAHEKLLALKEIRTADVCEFVHAIKGGPLRTAAGMNVTIGKHVPPLGGQAIVYSLDDMLARLSENPKYLTPYKWHCAYLTLHPFMDGNGRSARALYAWHSNRLGLQGYVSRGFLHQFYYDALGESDGRQGSNSYRGNADNQ